MKLRTNQRGFSLIELHCGRDYRHHRRHRHPQPARFKRAANEASAIASSRTHRRRSHYFSTKGNTEYGTPANLQSEGLIDAVLGTAPNQKSSYIRNNLLPSDATHAARHNATAVPDRPPVGASGTRFTQMKVV
jgi:hypothetical protein